MKKIILILMLLFGRFNIIEMFQVIDLSHALNHVTNNWPTEVEFTLMKNHRGLKNPNLAESEDNFWYEVNQFTMSEHSGTHLDAPVHFSRGAWSVDEIPPDRFMGPVSIIDLRQTVKDDADYLITSDDIKKWEEDTGKVLNPLIILWTGWASRWNNRTSYLGTDTRDTSQLRFPGLHPNAAKWLTENRKIFGIGIDTPSIDRGRSADRAGAHRILCPQNIFNLENLNTNPLSALSRPFLNPVLVFSPLKISGGSGSPIRPFIFYSKHSFTNGALISTNSFFMLLFLNVAVFTATESFLS